MNRIASCLCLLLAVPACSGDDVRGDGNPGSAGADAAASSVDGLDTRVYQGLPDNWLDVAEQPAFAVGRLEGETGEVLHRVRGAAVLDSTLVVASGSTSRLFYYDMRDGSLAGVAGAEGEGPGEFRSLGALLKVDDDTVAAFDWHNRRLSYFDASGTYLAAATFGTTEEGGVLQPVGAFDDGLLIRSVPPAETDSATGLVRNTVVYHRMPLFPSDASPGAALTTQPGDERFVVMTESGAAWRPILFGRRDVATACPDGFYVATGEEYEIRFLDTSGRLERRIRVDVSPRPVSEELVDAAIAERVGEVTDAGRRAAQERIWAETPHPQRLPAHGDIVAGPRCDVWVQDYAPPGEEAHWTIFTRDGAREGRVAMPPGFETLLAVGEGFLVGLFRDDLDTEQVRVYRYSAPASD